MQRVLPYEWGAPATRSPQGREATMRRTSGILLAAAVLLAACDQGIQVHSPGTAKAPPAPVPVVEPTSADPSSAHVGAPQPPAAHGDSRDVSTPGRPNGQDDERSRTRDTPAS